MIYSIQGPILQLHPTYVVIDVQGIAYQVFISLNTYSQLEGMKDVRLLTHFIVKEDAHALYGFFTEMERQIFIQLISVSGVGPNTARLILSSYEPDSIRNAIVTKDENLFKKIKGIGLKTAQRIIIDLQDKMGKDQLNLPLPGIKSVSGKQDEAFSALMALGFGRSAIDQVLSKLPERTNPEITVEELIKLALKKLAG